MAMWYFVFDLRCKYDNLSYYLNLDLKLECTTFFHAREARIKVLLQHMCDANSEMFSKKGAFPLIDALQFIHFR